MTHDSTGDETMSMLKERLNRHFATAAVAVGAAAFGVAQQANANIIHSGAVNIVIPDTIDGIYMNVVSGATGSSGGAVPGWDINPYTAAAGMFNLWGATTTTWLSAGGVIGGSYNLAFDAPIGPAGTFFRPGGGTNVAPQMNLNSSDNLLGFQFTNEMGGGTHYGWMRLEFGASAGARSIVEYAYEGTAGTAIGAGVVPAPGALALFGLAGVACVRRRRAS